MTRRHQRWLGTGFVLAIGLVAVAAYHLGLTSQKLLMFGWLAPLLALAYAAGINVWTGGPLDWDNDRILEAKHGSS